MTITVQRPQLHDPAVRGRLIVAAWIVALIALVPALALIRESLALPGTILPTPKPTDGIRLDAMALSAIRAFGDRAGLALVTGMAIAWLIVREAWRDALFVVIAVAIAMIAIRLAKNLFDAPSLPTVGLFSPFVLRIPNAAVVVIALGIIVGGRLTPRPGLTFAIGAGLLMVLAVQIAAGKSVPLVRGFDTFPSGHAGNSMALAFSVAWIALSRWPADRWVVGLAAVYAVAVGISTVYLGTHYLTEVFAGWSLAIASVLTCWLVRQRLDGSMDAGRHVGGDHGGGRPMHALADSQLRSPPPAQARPQPTKSSPPSGGGELTAKGRDGRIRMQDTIRRRDPRRSDG
ncbi:MAG TPA: phosphatase PAP2 family protein [Candidatus Limnocylindrales bacterium]|jgi:undecaprenyl-diphosphatase|nr:phosphatase PAP2 family protein [Candidatus Limnocylindrales bacterium]